MRRSAILLATIGLAGALLATPIVVFAGDQFNDVPDGHVFHNAIGWLADNAITKGCNPPANTNYCPDNDVNRGQMAAFMKRLSEGRVVDAGQLQGYAATELGSRAAFASNDDAPDGGPYTLSTTLVAPAPGIVIVTGAVDGQNTSSQDDYHCSVEVDDVVPGGGNMWSRLDGDGTTNREENCAATGAMVVDAGTLRVEFEIVSVDAATQLHGVALWAIWVPFDATGQVPKP
jgi:hypothetical protein